MRWTLAGGLWLACALFAGCGEATHTVGQLRGERDVDGPPQGGEGRSGAGGKGGDTGGSGGADAATLDAGGIPDFSDWQCDSRATQRRLDLYLMVDNQLALPGFDASAGVVQGLMRYFDDKRSTGTGVGIDYFETACNETAYATPTVEPNLMPGNAAALHASLDSLVAQEILPLSPSRMLPAVAGAVRYAFTRENGKHWKVSVVLISDGYPATAGCSSDPATAPSKAQAGFEGDPSISTYVVAIEGAQPTLDGSIERLDDIAEKGGTVQARRVSAWTELVPNQPSPFADAMAEVQRDATPCEYAPDSTPIDPNITLGVDDGNMTLRELTRVTDAASCTDNAYYMTPETSTAPAWAALCPTTCNQVKAQQPALWWCRPR